MSDGDRFPTTRCSAIIAAQSADRGQRVRAAEWIAAFYWKPVYKYIRMQRHKSVEDAKDLTQGFFARAFEKEFFESYDPAKARFRTFVKTCVDHFVANEDKAEHRIRRGGKLCFETFDFDGAEEEIRFSHPPAMNSPEDYFCQEWLRNLFSLSVETLRRVCQQEGKSLPYQLFARYDLDEDGPAQDCSYAALAEEFNIPVSQVTNHLSCARREFRRIVLEKLRDLTANEEEYRSEARWVLGVELP
jgi:DNA-directed RNA polymerase specialized sigma24 family protein